jgi:PTH2 family peptidyl-tRNA hydrolase
MKQSIILRTDLKMDKGKTAAQCAHASIASFLKAKDVDRKKWLSEGMKKVILKVYNEKELINLYKLAKKEKLPCELIIDAGLTQIKPGSITALGIGPANDKKMDKITGKLKLL